MADAERPITPDTTPPVPRLELKAALLLVLFALLLAGSVLYLMVARGAFEPVQRLVLVADDAEGVVVGMDITFAGFPIGRVRRIELGADGVARIVVDVPTRDAKWLRTSSVFTLVRSLVGGTAIKAYSGVLTDPPLPDGAERRVLAGDATAEIPRLMSDARALIANLTALTASDSALGGTLGNMQSVTDKLKGKQGALAMLLGNDEDARKVIVTLERTNTLLARLDGVVKRVDGTVARADQQILGAGGLLPETRAAVVQLNGLLADTRGTLQKVDGVLADAQVIAGNAKAATTDLGALRAEVEASLRKVELLVDELNRKWPFARDAELKLK
jgi:phospholipid/cholesterol/gamma-HCH transport system substrate-binding protein